MANINIELSNGQKAGETLKQLTNQAAALRKELGGLKPGTEDFVKSAQSLNQVEKIIGDVKEQVKQTVSASDLLKKGWNSLPGASFFNNITNSLGQMYSGVGGLISGFKVWKIAIAATGLGALVLIVGSIIAAFSKFAPLMDIVEQGMSALGAVVDVLTQRVISFGKGVLAIINGNWSKGIKEISGSFKGLGNEMEAAAIKGALLKKQQQDLEDSARGLEIANTRAEKQIDRLIAQSKNKSISDKEQIALLQQAREIANENFKRNDEQKRKELDTLIFDAQQKSQLSKEEIIMLTEGTLSAEVEYAKRGTIQDTLLDKIKDALKERIAAEGDTGKQLDKIQNAENLRLEKQSTARQKAIDDARKLREDEDKVLQKFEQDYQKRQDELAAHEDSRLAKDIKRQETRVKAIMDGMIGSIQARIAAGEKDLADTKAIEDAKVAMQHETLAVYNEGVNSVIQALGYDAAARKKHANEIKKLQSGQVLVNMFVEISEIAKTFASLGPFGQVLAAFRIAFSTARAFGAIKAINSQKFETGGPIFGPRHTGGGVNINAEGGEFIFSRKAVQAIGTNVLASMNNRYTFATGGPVNPFDNSRGSVGSGKASIGDDPLFRLEAKFETYAKAAAAQAEETSKRIDRITVTNNLQDTEKGLKTLNKLRHEADV